MTPAPQAHRLVITGASGALGQAILRHARAAGWSTASIARRTCPDADWSTCADLTNPQQTEDAFAHMEATWGLPDALIHAAGAGLPRLFPRLSTDSIDHLLDANLSTALHTARAVLPAFFRRGHGSLVFVGSLAALRPRPGQAVYAAAKGALESLTRALARELAPKSIRVNTLAPGFLDSPMVHSLPPAEQAALLATIPLGRLGTVDEAARAALFLASPAASYLTGQTLRLDGGASC